LAADISDGAARGAQDHALNVWHERDQVGQTIASGMNKNDRRGANRRIRRAESSRSVVNRKLRGSFEERNHLGA
jgi:hypothetical protein